MSHNLIIISAQCFENYGTPDSPHWKPKGEQKFNLSADTDHFFYGEEACIKAINTLLKRHHSNEMWKFEYRSHEIIFHKPIVLDSDEFEAELDNVLSK